jgi:hypothetical protein
MNHFLAGFADELTKEGGAITKALGIAAKPLTGTVKKYPIRSLLAGAILAGTATSAAAAHKGGLAGGEKGRYLAATRNNPGRAAFINYHKNFKHKPTKKEVKRLSKYHDKSDHSSYSTRNKGKRKSRS